MPNKTKIPDKEVIELADYVFFVNPLAKRADLLAIFGKRWQISDRSFDRIWNKAKQYNEQRKKTVEQTKHQQLVESTKERVNRDILTREATLEILSGIARGKARQVTIENANGKQVEVIIPTDRDRISAIGQVAKMEGWEAPSKMEINNLSATIQVSVADSTTPLATAEKDVK